MKSILRFMLLAGILMPSFLFADELGPQPRSNKAAQEWLRKAWSIAGSIPGLLDSSDPADHAEAIARTKQLLSARLKFVTGVKYNALINKFIEKDKLNELLELIDYGIAQHPQDTVEIIALQQAKVTVLTRLKRGDDAIVAAKGYYNISTMAGTGDAMQVLMTTLILVDHNNSSVAEKFKAEQIAGAEFDSSKSIKEPLSRTSVLQSIKVDPNLYKSAIDGIISTNWFALTGKGNLLLLADRVSEAQGAFDAAYLVADSKALPVAAENVARAMRAVDGSIGRANAYVESLRPKIAQNDSDTGGTSPNSGGKH